MDQFIKAFDAVEDRDLMFCFEQGVAYQRDMASLRVPYDDAYFDKYVGYEGKLIARDINAARVDLVNRHAGVNRSVVDVGIGSGEFIKSRANTYGQDINPKAIAWLKAQGKFAPQLDQWEAFSFWDVIEHVEEPIEYFRQIPTGGYLFTSLPIFAELGLIRASKHYRPGEHLYYWTERGFTSWMGLHGFSLIETNDCETTAGREGILSFAFQKAG